LTGEISHSVVGCSFLADLAELHLQLMLCGYDGQEVKVLKAITVVLSSVSAVVSPPIHSPRVPI
jgi:hypothetical protein